jgi:pilus assembly protein Flp/PilA
MFASSPGKTNPNRSSPFAIGFRYSYLFIYKAGNDSFSIQHCVFVRREKQMRNILVSVWRDDRGQDLIEYALMAGFVAVAAGAIMPGVSSNISEIFSKVSSVMTQANGS